MAFKMAIMAKYGHFEYLSELDLLYPFKRKRQKTYENSWILKHSVKYLLIDTHIGYSTMYSKWPYLAIMAILEAISYLLMVRKSFF